jgi:SAM-dependent methyltransferase
MSQTEKPFADPHSLWEALNAISPCVRYHRWIFNRIERELGRSILDVGSGLGDVAQFFGEDSSRQVVVSDHDEAMLAHMGRKFASRPNYRILKLNFGEELSPSLTKTLSVDTVTCINVIEHVQEDLLALKNLYRLLPSGGKLIVVVPYGPWLFGTLDELGGHFRRYNRFNLGDKMRQAGFQIEKQSFMNFFGMFTWFLAGKILKQRHFRPDTVQALDRIVPFLEKTEKIFRPPVGQTMIMIGRK